MAAGHDDTFHHVRDFAYFELPFGIKIPLPEIPFLPSPHKIVLKLLGESVPGGSVMGFQITKFMVLTVIAGLLALWFFRSLSKHVANGDAPKGPWWNFWETIFLFLRDDVVRPTIGGGHEPHGEFVNGAGLLPPGTPHQELHQFHSHGEPNHFNAHGTIAVEHPADRFLPFVASCFFFILFCNLLGMIPWLGSPTGSYSVTAPLAVTAFAVVIMTGMKAMGPVGYWKSLVPAVDLPAAMKPFLVPLIWLIEFLGLIIKHCVLAIRLFANIMAGHTVLGVLLGFIAGVGGTAMFFPVLLGSVFGQVAISGLELLFAFIQAYVFAFLATVFISMALHPH
jgi:F-type H+-transporting ATPase subunit a